MLFTPFQHSNEEVKEWIKKSKQILEFIRRELE